MLGKQKCKILKQIRQRIADENDIPYVTRECSFQGECRGTCPKCEAELRYLEQQLQLRQSLGKRVAVAALCTGMAFSAAGCTSPIERLEEIFGNTGRDLAGLVERTPTPTPEIEVTEGEVAWPDGPLEGEPAVDPEPIPGEVPDEGEGWELEGDVCAEPDPDPTEAGNG